MANRGDIRNGLEIQIAIKWQSFFCAQFNRQSNMANWMHRRACNNRIQKSKSEFDISFCEHRIMMPYRVLSTLIAIESTIRQPVIQINSLTCTVKRVKTTVSGRYVFDYSCCCFGISRRRTKAIGLCISFFVGMS